MGRYTARDGLRYYLQCKQEGIDPRTGKEVASAVKEFPDRDFDWAEQYFRFEETMNQKYHPNVNLGAAIAGDGLLTDHGVNHVKSVISHAQSILVDPMQLTGYELYLLLVSIHFHDVGNTLGRDKHEEKIESIIEKMGDSLSLDTAEQGFVTAIATAHGGYVDGSKDTIHAMNIVDESYDSVQIRCKLLAAILRFADEISDDLGRAAPPEISIPAANQAYHEYSKALVPVSIEGDTIKFQFRVPYDLTQNKIGKNGKKVYLYDEILNRLAKCMRELEYCKKYACGMIRLTTLNVVIGFLKQGSSHQFQESVPLRLTLQGYPDETRSSISDYLDAGLPGTVNGLKFKDGKAVRAAMSLK